MVTREGPKRLNKSDIKPNLAQNIRTLTKGKLTFKAKNKILKFGEKKLSLGLQFFLFKLKSFNKSRQLNY